VTSPIRYTLRAAAVYDPDPADGLTEARTALLDELGGGVQDGTALLALSVPYRTP
jgi:hypothetical protein